MSKANDMLKTRNLRCPHCHAKVEVLWNLKASGQVRCVNRCSEGKYAMWVEDCIDVSDEEEELIGVEDLDEIVGEVE